jgi:beta-N-acetylhexosaminidase
VSDLLRRRMGFEGAILTDDLEMGAVNQQRPAAEVALEALDAGNDLVMFCKSWDRIEETHDALVRALESGDLDRSRIDASLSRIFSLKRRLSSPGGMPAFDPLEFQKVCGKLERLRQVLEG